MTLNRITENIWVGSILSLRARKELAQGNVTHILSLLGDDGDSNGADWKKLPIFSDVQEHLLININDVEDADIMQYFDRTCSFIEEAVSRNEGVLVHCAAGISRSVTCTCAYLMKANKWDGQTAIDFVKSKRPVANPNLGYKEQLQIFYESGYEISDDSSPYRNWKLKHHAKGNEHIYTTVADPKPNLSWKQVIPQLIASERLDSNKFSLTERLRINGIVHASFEKVQMPQTDPVQFKIGEHDFVVANSELRAILNKAAIRNRGSMRCKGCSTRLASPAVIVQHQVGTEGACQHFFIEPVEWMRSELEKGDVEGKLACPKCTKKVGAYQWQGSKCTCGTWVTPSIKLSKAKVDGMGFTPLL